MDIIIKRAVTISGSRFLALSMPVVSFIILGYFSAAEITLHTLATQLIQISVVILVMSGIGVNFIIGKDSEDKAALSSHCFGYLFCTGLICFIVLSVYSLFVSSGILRAIVIVLALSMPFTASYVANSAILESNGYERKIFRVSLVTSVLNILISVPLAFSFSHPAMMVALSTTLIRATQLLLSLYYIKKHLGFFVKPALDLSVSKTIFRLSASDIIASLAFIIAIYFAVIFTKNNFGTSSVAALGISLSHMNIMSVVCISFCVSYIIQLSGEENLSLRIARKHIKLTLSFFSVFGVALILLNPFFTFMYNASGSVTDMASYLLLSVIVVLTDGIAIFFNSHLRLYGFKITPPLFRLAFVFVEIPVGCYLAVHMNDAEYLIIGMITGNALSLLLSCAYYCFKITATRYSNQPG